MKKISLITVLVSLSIVSRSQTNIFPADGNVGLGIVIPTSKLDVNGIIQGRNTIKLLDHNNILKADFSYDNSIDQMYLFGHKPNSIFSVYTGGNRQFDITSSGNVGIGISSPSSRLDVNGEIKARNSFKILDYNSTLKGEFSYDNSIDQMYLFGYRPNSIFSIYTGGSRQFDITSNGNVGIGTTTPTEKLSVNGNIRAKEIKVETSNWPDYVFEKDYKILGLKDLEHYIKINKHLPEVPSANKIEQDGLAIGEMNKILLKKIEELTLHLIEKDKELKSVSDLHAKTKTANIKQDLLLADLLKRIKILEK